jgi:hypothetical protein
MLAHTAIWRWDEVRLSPLSWREPRSGWEIDDILNLVASLSGGLTDIDSAMALTDRILPKWSLWRWTGWRWIPMVPSVPGTPRVSTASFWRGWSSRSGVDPAPSSGGAPRRIGASLARTLSRQSLRPCRSDPRV